jgi:hypothetical protein
MYDLAIQNLPIPASKRPFLPTLEWTSVTVMLRSKTNAGQKTGRRKSARRKRSRSDSAEEEEEEEEEEDHADLDEEVGHGSPAPPQPANGRENDFDEEQVFRATRESLRHRRGPFRIKGG